MIHIYYGFGKGKTSSAIGAGMRAKGAGMDVLLVQFLKDSKSSELSVLPFDIFDAPNSLPFNPDDCYKEWTDRAVEYINSSNCDMIILDELLDAVPKFVDIDSIIFDDTKEYIITGHKALDLLFEKADYITHFEKKAHPFDKGVSSRLGIEY